MLENAKYGFLKIRVKPGSPKTEALGWDESIKAYRINIHAKALDNKANIELLKTIKRLTGKKAEIASGARSRDKLVRFT